MPRTEELLAGGRLSARIHRASAVPRSSPLMANPPPGAARLWPGRVTLLLKGFHQPPLATAMHEFGPGRGGGGPRNLLSQGNSAVRLKDRDNGAARQLRGQQCVSPRPGQRMNRLAATVKGQPPQQASRPKGHIPAALLTAAFHPGPVQTPSCGSRPPMPVYPGPLTALLPSPPDDTHHSPPTVNQAPQVELSTTPSWVTDYPYPIGSSAP